MTRFVLFMLGVTIAGATGCAQCDTCDDFPAPCVGPNCGQNGFATNGFIPPTQNGMPENPAMTTAPSGAPNPTINDGSAADSPNVPSPTMPATSNPSGYTPPSPGVP